MLCRPDADVLVPVFSPYGRSGIVSPFAVERNISLLMRFDYPLTDGKSLVAHHGHRIRKELIDFWEDNKLEGSDLGLRSTKVRPHAQVRVRCHNRDAQKAAEKVADPRSLTLCADPGMRWLAQ